MKYYYTYRIDCTAIGWEDYYYLGKHVTSNLNDGYKGSGKKLKEYYTLYPDDYIFTILSFYSNKTELSIAEHNLIGELYKTDPYCLNRNAGGNGSWAAAATASSISRKGRPLSEEHKKKIGLAQKGRKRPEFAEKIKGKGNPMYGKSAMKGKHHSAETRIKQSNAKSGKNNPMYGKPGTNLGKPCRDETKIKLSKANKGKHRVYREDGTYYYTK